MASGHKAGGNTGGLRSTVEARKSLGSGTGLDSGNSDACVPGAGVHVRECTPPPGVDTVREGGIQPYLLEVPLGESTQTFGSLGISLSGTVDSGNQLGSTATGGADQALGTVRDGFQHVDIKPSKDGIKQQDLVEVPRIDLVDTP